VIDVDPRGRKVAVVAEEELVERLPALREACYGLMQLPPAGLAPAVAAEALQQLAEQVAEYVRNGYEVALAGDGGAWRTQLDDALASAGVTPLPPVAA
jgi:hypothetical protein